ncbi:MAG: histone deacetylase [Myxococcales bacterium]|nr:histone deacetylase [Myxococcales bacterium]
MNDSDPRPDRSETPPTLRARFALGASRIGRALRDLGLPLAPRAYLVYHDDYVDVPRTRGARHAFDALRPQRIIRELRGLGLVSRRNQVLEPKPLSRAELLTTHPAPFLDDIMRADRLSALLHVDPDPLHPDPFYTFALQGGGTLLAARQALLERAVVFNLGGGFHHAQRDRAEGFCPINDVAVAINVLRQRDMVRRVLVVDLDYHHGNGTALIFEGDDDVFTFSVHGQHWADIDPHAANLDIELPSGTGDSAYLAAVKEGLDAALRQFVPELVIYLAGADPLAGDRLGDFAISEQGMLERDLHVYHTFAARRVPFAVALAGGYGPLAWSVPFNFIYSVLAGTPIGQRLRPSNLAARLERRRMTTEELRALDKLPLETVDILAQLEGAPVSGRFLDFYTLEAIDEALERYELHNLLRERGFDPQIAIDTSENARHLLRVYDGPRRSRENLLIELAARRGRLELCELEHYDSELGKSCAALVIEWLLMQDPRASFSLERPQLPGQDHPGLGIGRWIIELLRLMAQRLDCAALTNHPQTYANAVLYGAVMRFVDPALEGRFRALERDLGHLPLVDAAWAVERGEVYELSPDEGVLRWSGEEQMLPTAGEVARYVDSDAYADAMRAAYQSTRFELRSPR